MNHSPTLSFPAASQAGRDEEKLRAALERDIAGQLAHLPLELHLESGGWPQNVRLQGLKILTSNDDELRIGLTMTFSECAAACCSGDNYELERTIFMTMAICKKNWQGRVVE